jgi:hypothetical protein
MCYCKWWIWFPYCFVWNLNTTPIFLFHFAFPIFYGIWTKQLQGWLESEPLRCNHHWWFIRAQETLTTTRQLPRIHLQLKLSEICSVSRYIRSDQSPLAPFDFVGLSKLYNSMFIFGEKLWKINVIFLVPGSIQELTMYRIWKLWHQRAYVQNFWALSLAILEKIDGSFLMNTLCIRLDLRLKLNIVKFQKERYSRIRETELSLLRPVPEKSET